MPTLLLKNQIQVLVTIQASNLIEKVELTPYSAGFGCEIQGNPPQSLIKQIYSFLEGYAAKKDSPLPPLNWDLIHTSFTEKVLHFLTTIPFGKKLFYKEIGIALHSPKGSRAVGGACGRNPFPLFIPCHRVLAQSGLGGFSCGLDIKKSLLAFESTLS